MLQFGGCLVELAPVGDPAGVRAAIAAALELPDPSRLAELIGDREMLIVLDNCEHVITTAAEVAEDLLRRCPALRLLATSREGLRVGGETIWPVPPLEADDAVRLFVARARAAGAPLELSDEHHAVIADICARLDGLPLAIELAAARTRAFPIAQIASRLNDRFRLLTGGSRTALPRQQTLRARGRLELRAALRRRAARLRAAVGVPRRLRPRDGGGGLRRRDDRARPTSPTISTRSSTSRSSSRCRSGDRLRFTQLQTLAQYGKEKLTERGDAVRDAQRDGAALRRAVRAERGRVHGRRAASVADGDRPGARQPPGRARLGGRQRRRGHRADDRGRRELAALAAGHGDRRQALARRRVRVRRRGRRAHACAWR